MIHGGAEYRDGVHPEETPVRARPTAARLVLVGLLALGAAWHLLGVTAAAVPPNTYSEAVRPSTAHLGSYFAQNWRLFAPNPVASDRTVRFQGAYEQDGRLVTTDWVDWTAVELDLVRHRLVGGRAGYVTNKMYGPLGSRYRSLDPAQREVADVADPAGAPAWPDLRRDLRAGSDAPTDDREVDLYLVYDRAATRLATEVLEATHEGRRMVAVRYALRSVDVTPWEYRGLDAEARERLRRAPEQRINGWRPAARGGAAEQAAVARFWQDHR